LFQVLPFSLWSFIKLKRKEIERGQKKRKEKITSKINAKEEEISN